MPFQRILDHLVARTPGASGAVFVDWEGETVVQALPRHTAQKDEADYRLRVIGAHKALILARIEAVMGEMNQSRDELRDVVLRLEGGTLLARRVSGDYVLILALDRDAAPSLARHPLQEAAERLRREL